MPRPFERTAALVAMIVAGSPATAGPATADSRAADMPLPIGDGQTISQPFIVAYMTHLLGVVADARVLEVGTGSVLPSGGAGRTRLRRPFD